MTTHQYQDLISLFNKVFYEQFNTKLERGDDEPIYLPSDNQTPHHRIIFAHGFYASALHEVAHWLVAGEKRRLLEDYGYWYEPDGRTTEQQSEFEKVEIVPQAIEWSLSVACGIKFDVSVDNLSGIEIDRLGFKRNVKKKVQFYLDNGFSLRTQALLFALHDFYKTAPLNVDSFKL